MTRSRSITDTHLRAGRTKELRAMTLLDMGGLLPLGEWVTMAKISKTDALVGIPIFSEKAHLNKCCSAMALFVMKEI